MALTHERAFDAAIVHESPWYWPLHAAWSTLAGHARFPNTEELSACYAHATRDTATAPALRFVGMPKVKPKRRPRGVVDTSQLYEGRIVDRGEVPQRPDDWHDLFNALAFITFPRAKATLHTRQYAALRARLAPGATRLPGARTREQDALSLFDEGGVIIVADPAAAADLDVSQDDLTLPLHAHVQAGRAHVIPFGHALYEHMVFGLPCPLATPHVLRAELAWQDAAQVLATVDDLLTSALSDPDAFTEPTRCKGLSLSAFEAHPPADVQRRPSVPGSRGD